MTDRLYTCISMKLYPNREQEKFLDQQVEKLRYVYNACLTFLKRTYLRTGTVCRQFDLNNFCVLLWKRNPWLHTIYNNCMHGTASQALQAFKKTLENSKLKGRSGCRRFPRYRRKGEFNSFGHESNRAFKVYDAVDSGKVKRYVELGKLPGRIRARNLQEMVGIPKTIKILRKDMGTHYGYACSVVFELPEGYCEDRWSLDGPVPYWERKDVGIDLGLHSAAYFSDGTVYENTHAYERQLGRFRKIHEAYSRSAGLPDERKKKSILEHAYVRLKNLRKDLRDRIVNDAVFNYRNVFIEDLSIKQLEDKAEGKRMRRLYADAGLGDLAEALCRKSQKTQHRVVKVNPAYTSIQCSACGTMVPKDLSVRVHRCPVCGFTADRDYNAALNILKRGSAGDPSS